MKFPNYLNRNNIFLRRESQCLAVTGYVRIMNYVPPCTFVIIVSGFSRYVQRATFLPCSRNSPQFAGLRTFPLRNCAASFKGSCDLLHLKVETIFQISTRLKQRTGEKLLRFFVFRRGIWFLLGICIGGPRPYILDSVFSSLGHMRNSIEATVLLVDWKSVFPRSQQSFSVCNAIFEKEHWVDYKT